MIRCASYNCNSIRNNSENVKELLNKNDIVFLQELMLSKSDLCVLNDFDNRFEYTAFVQDRESEGINEGRPSKGVAIYWRKHLSSNITPLLIDDSLIGIILKSSNNSNNKTLFLNVYLPCDSQNPESFDNYRNALARLEIVIKEQNFNTLVLIGDFNADPFKGRFWKELLSFTKSLSLKFLDERLPCDTFTYLCPAKDSTSWLDHIFATELAVEEISNIYIDYKAAAYDHFPLLFNFDFNSDLEFYAKEDNIIDNMVYWNRMNNEDKNQIKEFIDSMITEYGLLDHELFFCTKVNCKNETHLKYIEDIFKNIISILTKSTSDFCAASVRNFKIIPGWNEFVKELYADARDRFLEWKIAGKPTSGIHRDRMHDSRAHFKNALDYCKKNEKQIRNEKLSQNLRKKNFKQFWSEVHKTNRNNTLLPSRIDNLSGESNIANAFADKYKKILDKSNRGKSSAQDFEVKLDNVRAGVILGIFSRFDIESALKQMKPNIGPDSIHTNHLLLGPQSFVYLIAQLYSSCIMHGYSALSILEGQINPLMKDVHGDIASSENYRPIMSSSVFLKLFEYCILAKINTYLNFNDHQHGFRKDHSTSTACLVLKETVLHYINSDTSVYGCFIDITKAFDSVDHHILLEKLIDAGIPNIFVNFIKFWYSNQKVRVKFGNALSRPWMICNGVRQGGILSSLFFNLYIDSVLSSVSKMNIGCKLGFISSNIIAYADDVVLLAPSATGLQQLIDKFCDIINELDLSVNINKTKCMIFNLKHKDKIAKCFNVGENCIQYTDVFKYLGFYIQDNMRDNEDIVNVRGKFYRDFNCVLRKFAFLDKYPLLYLFKQYCLQFYGAELWIGPKYNSNALKQFAIGYHKAIKKILKLSTHESNHYACQEAGLFTFEHLMNKIQIFTGLRFMVSPCEFMFKNYNFFRISSFYFKELRLLSRNKYSIDSLVENDKDAILSRICFVQNHEPQLRNALP